MSQASRPLSTVAVLGSNSFSGASFVAYALEQGADVLGFSRSDEAPPPLLPYRWGTETERFRFIRADLNHDLERIDQILRQEKVSHIVNFAAQSMVAESWANPDHWFMTNVVSTVRLHERLRHYDFLDCYLHVTTPEVYGSVSGCISEETPFNPSTPYAVSRAAADMSLKTYHAAYGFPVVFTRAANVYGPGQALYRIIPRTLMCIREGKKLQLQGGGASQRSFIHIRDVAEATWKLLQHGQKGETYHISTRELISIRSLVEQICIRQGVAFDAVVSLAPERLGKDAVYSLDSHKLRSTLGWADRISLAAGLDDCCAWMERFFPELCQLPQSYQHKP